jgi:hypothetical protein
MKRETITITDDGSIVAPQNPNRVRMTIVEIADLLGIYCPTAKRHIRAIEKAGIAGGDYLMCCVVGGGTVQPEYYCLDMIIAVSFRVKSWQADRFRQWLTERVTQPTLPPISVFVPLDGSRLLN